MVTKILNRFREKGQELKKGSSFEITEGIQSKVCIGLNWSGIPKQGTFNKMLKLCEPVDLDGALATFRGKVLDEIISYKNMLSSNGSMRHSGDDRMGDLEGNDGMDNETMIVNLDKVHPSVDSIYVYLRSVQRHDFADIPYAILRIFQIIPGNKIPRVIATFNLSQNPKHRGSYAMLMGKFEKKESANWTFTALGNALPVTDLQEIGSHIANQEIGK